MRGGQAAAGGLPPGLPRPGPVDGGRVLRTRFPDSRRTRRRDSYTFSIKFSHGSSYPSRYPLPIPPKARAAKFFVIFSRVSVARPASPSRAVRIYTSGTGPPSRFQNSISQTAPASRRSGIRLPPQILPRSHGAGRPGGPVSPRFIYTQYSSFFRIKSALSWVS